ncbi:MAG TPA: HEAT repeat domain-containing protein [Vicinamibacterales bacterium]
MNARFAVILVALVIAAGAAGFWYSRQAHLLRPQPHEIVDGNWMEHLHSQNPKVAEEAARQVEALGADALPEIRAALQDPRTDDATKKAALKAVGLLGPRAAPLVDEVASQLTDPELTEEAAVALSFMGRDAYAPLRLATTSDDPVVRREALRSLGKLRERAPLDERAVVPLLLKGLADPDADVRVVSATYLGIIEADDPEVVPALIETLNDEDPEVRAAAATALGSFPGEAKTILPALKKARGDKDEAVAREAGLAIVKVQSSSPR